MLGFFLALLAVGVVAGFLARWIVPGPDPLSLARTMAIGLGGSLAGGYAGFWLFGGNADQVRDWVAGLLGALTGAVVLLMADNYATGRKNQITA